MCLVIQIASNNMMNQVVGRTRAWMALSKDPRVLQTSEVSPGGVEIQERNSSVDTEQMQMKLTARYE